MINGDESDIGKVLLIKEQASIWKYNIDLLGGGAYALVDAGDILVIIDCSILQSYPIVSNLVLLHPSKGLFRIGIVGNHSFSRGGWDYYLKEL